MRTAFDKNRFKLFLWMGLGYFFLGVLTTLGTYPDRFFAVVFNNFWGVLYLVPVNFILFEHSLPFVMKKGKAVAFGVLWAIFFLFLYIMLYSYGSYVWRLLGIQLHIYTRLKVYTSIDHVLQSQMGYNMGSVFLFGIIRHAYNYIKLKQAAAQLRIEKQEAELNYLRSQTNPHFLFNTLNNIYSLARDKSDQAPASILKLSQLLRYMLYEASGSYIAVEKELKNISDYIDLERLRYDESLQINFNYDMEDGKQSIPPLLLMPLVENAFKHGVSETRNQPFVDIHLSIRQRQLVFVVKNSSEGVGEKAVKENIGLSNLRRQLELLYTDYTLLVEQGKNDFTATLKINLASHV